MEEKDVVVYAGQNISGDYIIVTNNGFVKRLNALQIPMCARYSILQTLARQLLLLE